MTTTKTIPSEPTGIKPTDLAKDFLRHLEQNPTERFWQGLLNWSGLPYIVASPRPPVFMTDTKGQQDTFYWSGKNEFSIKDLA